MSETRGRLGEICEFHRGLTYSKSDEVDTSSNVVLRANNIDLGSHRLDFAELRYINDNIEIPQNKKLKKDSILVCTASGSKSHLGKAAYIDDDYAYAFGGFMGMITPKAGVVSRYVFHAMTSVAYREFIEELSDGANINNLRFDDLGEFSILLPSFSEQRRIAAILDEAFANINIARANAEKNLQNAGELFESQLEMVFGGEGKQWNQKRLRDVAKDFGRGRSKHRPRGDPRLYGGPYPFIQTGDVRNSNHLITSSSQTYSELGLAQSKLWPRGSLCITIAANIAETGILDFDACFPDSVIGVVADEAITSNKFLEYSLQSFKVLLQEKGQGSAQDNINLGTFENQLFPFPDLKRQQAVVSMLDSLRENVQALESISQRKLAVLDELKQSLLHEAFSGKL